MLLNDLVVYCNKKYEESECDENESLVSFDHLCNGSCRMYLNDIHFHRNSRRLEYNCERLLYYYVCRYSYKYCSEMIYALKGIDLSSYPYYHIVSLGCGGAPDLFAFQYIHTSKPISYYGLDNNKYWKDIHYYIKSNFHDGKVLFRRDIDVLEYFKEHRIKGCNVIIIQYLISFFYSQLNVNGMQIWFEELAKNIVKYKSEDSRMLIIINDVDSIETGIGTFPILIEKIKNIGLNVVNVWRKRFNNISPYQNSEQYSSNHNLFGRISEDFQKEYSVAIRCHSVQMILEVE